MAVVQTLIGNIKGPAGATGATGPQGPQGDAATIEVGSVSTTAYGNAAQVTNVGSSSAAKFNFVIPQGKPGEQTTKMGGLTLDTITTSTADFPSPQVGDTGATAFGKIVKFFADALTALQNKLDSANVVNNQTTTEAGYALDARQANPNVAGSLGAKIDENTFFVRKSNPISKAVTANSSGTANVSYPDSVPSGYEIISRCFYRTDEGGYNIIITCPLYQNYINYLSTGSAPTLTGYVIDLYKKS